MAKIMPVKRIVGYNVSLYEEINSLRNSTKEQVQKLYGDIGVDIFEGRKPTILSQDEIKKSKRFVNRIKAWWSGMGIFDYEYGDRLRDVILKYAYNKKSGRTEDIKTMFGENGISELKIMEKMGYIEI